MKLNITGESIDSLLYWNNKPALELKISYPQLIGPISQRSEYGFNNEYRKQARSLNKFARTKRYFRVAKELEIAEKQEHGFTLNSLISTFTVPRLDTRFTSILFDKYEYDGGLHGMRTYVGNTWDFSVGTRVPLSYFFRRNSNYQAKILKEIQRQIQSQKMKEEILFFENPLTRAKQYFNEKNFYLTNDSVAIFYPLYSIAPYQAGILNYKIPFELLDGCWIKNRKPEKTEPYSGEFSTTTEYL